MPEVLGALVAVCRKFCGLRGGYAGTVVLSGWVCWNFWGLGGEGMPELLLAHEGVCRDFWGLKGGGMPEILRA